MNCTKLYKLADKISEYLIPIFGEDYSLDRSANLMTAIGCADSYHIEYLKVIIRESLRMFREDHCGGFKFSDYVLEVLTAGVLDILRADMLTVVLDRGD
jgi:hypothetical protein